MTPKNVFTYVTAGIITGSLVSPIHKMYVNQFGTIESKFHMDLDAIMKMDDYDEDDEDEYDD